MRVEQLLRDLRAARAAGEQVLGAVDLGRLAEDDRAALADDLVGRAAERRVRGHAGPAVRAAALERDDELRGGHVLAHGLVGDGQEPGDRLDAGRDGAREAAVLLDREHARPLPVRREAGTLEHLVRLVDLAAEGEDDVRRDVRVVDDAAERPLELRQVG